jgi:hypothetical protein
LRRSQIVLEVDGVDRVVELGRGGLPKGVTLQVGDAIAVTGSEQNRGRGKVFRATQLVIGEKTYELNVRKRQRQRPPAKQAPQQAPAAP